MASRQGRTGAGRAVALLATCIVVLLGAFACTVIVITSSSDPTRPLAVAGGCFAAIAALLWLIRDRRPENRHAVRWGWLRGRRRRFEYRLSPRSRGVDRPRPTLEAPTAESVRELSDGLHTWVPTQGAPARPRRNAGIGGQSMSAERDRHRLA